MRKILFMLLAVCMCSCEPTQCHIYPPGYVREYQHNQSQKYGRCVYFKWDKDGIVHCGCYDDRCVEYEIIIDPIDRQRTKRIAKPNQCRRSSYWISRNNKLHCGCYDNRCVKEKIEKNKTTKKIK